jgi:signal transduction histidine kinase
MADVRAPPSTLRVAARTSGRAVGRPRFLFLALAGFVAGLAASWIVASSGHLVYAAPFAVLEAVEVWTSVAIALIYRAYRPKSPVGYALIAYGFVNALIGLEGSSDPALSLFGALAEVPAVALVVYLILVYRRPTLGNSERLVLGAWTALVIAEYAIWFVSQPSLVIPTPLATCASNCPSNPIFVPAFASVFSRILPWLDPAYRLGIFVLLALVFVIYSPTLGRSVPERLVMLPVLSISSVWLLGSTLYGASQLSSRESEVVFWVLYLGRLIFPISFACGLLAVQSFGAAALYNVLTQADSRDQSMAAATLARALSDPAIVLAWWNPTRNQFVDANGDVLAPPSPESGRVMTTLYRSGHTVGAIVSDSALAQYPELLEAVGVAVTLNTDKGRLESDLQRSLESFIKSREELATAAESQRRRIERDLHDSVQQELLATEMRLLVVRGLVTEDLVRERLSAICKDVELALQHLREIVHGEPATELLHEGLGGALGNVAARAPIAVRLEIRGPDRYPAQVERAIYFCCLEALQNAERHAGERVRVTIEISGSDTELVFRVGDDGPGFDQVNRPSGQGLKNMADRMQAVGGWLTIESTPGKGTIVSGGVEYARSPRPDHR